MNHVIHLKVPFSGNKVPLSVKTAAICLATMGLLAGPAMAKSSAPMARVQVKIDKSLKKLPFGKNVKSTLKWIGARMRSDSRSRVRKKLKHVREGMVSFVPSADLSSHRRSIIADEFKVGNAESMLRWNDGRHQHYFFFHNGKLYKYAKPVMVPQTTLGFVDRVNILSKHLGAPTGTYSPAGGDNVVEARWVTNTVETRIVDKRAKFNADVLLVEHFKLCRKVEDARRGHASSGAKTYAVDPKLKEFLE